MIKLPILASLFLISCASTENISTIIPQQVLDGDHRSEKAKNRDTFRHPAETLSFFELKSDMTVVEIWPSGGWYTDILAPLVKDKGQLDSAHFSADSDVAYFTKKLTQFKQKISRKDIYGDIIITSLQPPKELNIAPKGSADRVLTFRNVHNWMKIDQADAVFKAMYDALKPGGMLGVVEHRAKPGTAQDPKALSGYVTEAHVIALAEKAGFKLVASSEINANPKDSTLHPRGVWTLPPSLRLKQQNQEHYLSIGESDRMTLKFIK